MICSRCGTEYNEPDKICPRCFFGRPKEKVRLPKWVVWLISVGVPLVVVTIATVLVVSEVRSSMKDRWLDGVWENDKMALIVDHADHSFQLISGETSLIGKYKLEDGQLRLIADEGSNYIYYYELEDENTLNISFADGQYIVREKLERIIIF